MDVTQRRLEVKSTIVPMPITQGNKMPTAEVLLTDVFLTKWVSMTATSSQCYYCHLPAECDNTDDVMQLSLFRWWNIHSVFSLRVVEKPSDDPQNCQDQTVG